MEQLALLLDAEQPAARPARPRCRMCVRPARWVRGAEEWGMYCAGRACSSRERLCQRCGAPFTMGIDGAGTKYCSTECKRLGYHPERADAPPSACAWCDRLNPYVGRRRQTKWPYVCSACTEPIKHIVTRLRDHNVPHDRARLLLTDPGCEVCGANMLTPVRNSARKVEPLLVVDHDHSCCPAGQRSCGKCVRGLICRGCNAAAGQLYDNPNAARSLAAYLDRWKGAA